MSTDLVSNGYVIAVCVAYGGAAWLIQMCRVAAPRDWLLERIYSLKARIETERWAADTPGRDELTQIEKSVDRWALVLPVSKVQAGWRNVHGIEDQHILELPTHLVDEQLKSVRTRLAALTGDEPAALVKRIDEMSQPSAAHETAALLLQVLGPESALVTEATTASAYAPSPQSKAALLQQASIYLHNVHDKEYEDIASLLGKAVWLTVASLAVVAGLALLFDREGYFLFGAAGALISRLTRVLKKRPTAADYGAAWSTLILSPAAGAVAGWTGVLIAHELASDPFNVLGDPFAEPWVNASASLGFLLAFLSGFSERFFDRLVATAQTQVGKLLPEEK